MNGTDISRRKFLKKVGQSALIVGGISVFESLISGCSTIPEDTGPISLEQLKGNKVKFPDQGLLWGTNGFFEQDMTHFHGSKDSEPEFSLPVYKDLTGHMPAVHGRMCSVVDQHAIIFNKQFIMGDNSLSIIPYDLLSVGYQARLYGGLEKLIDNKEFLKSIESYAEKVVEHKVPMMVTTMREMNDSYGGKRPWKGKSPKTVKKVYRQMWQVCEDMGANNWLTWVWSITTPEGHSASVRNPELFYPGDDQVDYIGFSVYGNFMGGSIDFPSMIGRTYRQMQKNHPTKPIMMSEIGYFLKPGGSDKGQADFFNQAILTMHNLKAFKALIIWNSSSPKYKRDYTLSKAALNIIKKYLDDGVLLGADYKKQIAFT